MDRATIEKIYGREQVWEAVDPSKFKHLDLGYYDRCQHELESQGFRYLGDAENQTLKGGFEDLRTFLRVFISRDGVIQSAICHPKPPLWVRCLIFITGSRIGRVCDFETEFADGSFVGTSNAKLASSMPPVPCIDIEYHEVSTTLEQLLERHKERIEKRLQESPDSEAVRISSAKDLWASQARMHETKKNFYLAHYNV